jgi:hypothetical protein
VRVLFLTLFCLCVNVFSVEAHCVFVLAGECVTLDSGLQPQFTPAQLTNSAAATRAGFVRWAATSHGRRIIESLNAAEHEVRITEDSGEDGLGRAPQPGIATLMAATDHAQKKSYELVLNPTFFALPEGMTPLPNQAVTPVDMMAAAWAGEMLHIYFYSQGISLPHHQRPDFQREWRAVASELGMPGLTHDDEDERRRMSYPARVIVLGSARGR